MTTSGTMPDLVDWDLAARTATRLAGTGPVVTADEAQQTVADLRHFAAEAETHVREVTDLDGPSGSAPVVVVDRAGWVTANTESLRTVITPLVQKVQRARQGRTFGPLDQIGPKATGLETGAFLAFVAGRVLGQFDPFWTASGDSAPPGPGRLLLVAPNVVHVERELGVIPRDFRMWVCLHEETHRVQFTAVPWLRAHLESEIAEFVGATQIDAGTLAANVRDMLRALMQAIRGEREGLNLMDMLQSPQQRAVVQRVTALMSLLEGHADVVMDRVGADVVPTVETIRRRFQRRRKGASSADRMVRRALGFEAKMRQYRDGARFVDQVIERVGMAGFNRVWDAPETLPTVAEIAEPDRWVQRVHGAPA